jgi:hypothetical protein
VPHLLRHRTSFFKVIYERPVILTSECLALCEGAISTYFNVFGLTLRARAGLELTTSRMLSESTTIRLSQPVQWYRCSSVTCRLVRSKDGTLLVQVPRTRQNSDFILFLTLGIYYHLGVRAAGLAGDILDTRFLVRPKPELQWPRLSFIDPNSWYFHVSFLKDGHKYPTNEMIIDRVGNRRNNSHS